ncbi:hypothetical protein D9615_009426 [Tricholomella constricta]|uniref:Uncharacterized protein n=1 Tax=Tricholomella constricta TaxID=117010 RepID=A0A8H5GY88_9AGAR|nr:hypothetical protein D9615_009426 [Tricholomella constricta]
MPIHLPDKHKYYPAVEEKVIAVFRNQDRQKRYDFLDITTGVNRGLDMTYWKEGYTITDVNGYESVFCPGLLYPRSLTVDEVWSRIAERLGAYVFPTPANWRPDPEDEAYTYSVRAGGARDLGDRCGAVRDGEWDREKTAAAATGEREREKERCVMCADRKTYWAVSPPVFLSRHSRRWHVHVDCLQHLMPRCQFGMKPVEVVEYV